MLTNNYAIYLIGNPTHYINCVEYLHKFPATEKKMLIVLSDFGSEISEIRKTIFTDVVWDRELILDYSNNKGQLSVIKEQKKAFRLLYGILSAVEFEKVVIANLGDSFFYALIQKLRINGKKFSIDCLDDGTPSIKILEARQQNKYYSRFHLKPIKYLVKDLISFGMILPLVKPFHKATFFSLFDIQPSKNDTLILNEYAVLKNRYHHAMTDESKAIFIGSTLVEKGIVGKEAYLQKIREVSDFFDKQGKQLIYLAHRLENLDKFLLIQNEIQLQTSTLPIEIALLNYNKIPKTVCSFFSSALINLRHILPVQYEIISFILNESIIHGTHTERKEDILNIYKRLGNEENIQSIKI